MPHLFIAENRADGIVLSVFRIEIFAGHGEVFLYKTAQFPVAAAVLCPPFFVKDHEKAQCHFPLHRVVGVAEVNLRLSF